MQIRDNRLYREIYGTFEEYCKEKWNISRPRAYQLIKGAEVQENLSTIVDIKNEAQTRPLTKLPPDEQREVYQKAVETAPEGKVTAWSWHGFGNATAWVEIAHASGTRGEHTA